MFTPHLNLNSLLPLTTLLVFVLIGGFDARASILSDVNTFALQTSSVSMSSETEDVVENQRSPKLLENLKRQFGHSPSPSASDHRSTIAEMACAVDRKFCLAQNFGCVTPEVALIFPIPPPSFLLKPPIGQPGTFLFAFSYSMVFIC